jgi:primosomal protein N''
MMITVATISIVFCGLFICIYKKLNYLEFCLDEANITLNRLRTLENTVHNINGRIISIMTSTDIEELRAQLRAVERILVNADLSEDVPDEIPENYDENPDINYQVDPGGTTIESMMRSR